MYARKNFGQLLNEVSLLKESFVIERSGRPMAALMPIDPVDEEDQTKAVTAAFQNLVKRIKGPRTKKLERAISELSQLLDCEVDPS